MIEPILIFPDPAPPELAQALDLAGYSWAAVGTASAAEREAPENGWGGAIICIDVDADGGFSLARQIRRTESPLEPVMFLISGAQLAELDQRDELFDDFCLSPFQPREFEARLRHLFWKAGTGTQTNVVEYGDLALNVETYQAAVSGQPLDLTYMEYELLKFLVSNPGKVFTREALLSQVWGYDYFGGARTVDVHVRRLRAKLGEERASLIQTVRSVGYKFGKTSWL